MLIGIASILPGDEVLLSIKQLRLRGGFMAMLAPRYVGPFKVLSNIGSNNTSHALIMTYFLCGCRW
jgi:hypothetical protein